MVIRRFNLKSLFKVEIGVCLLISCFAIGNYQAKVDSDVTRSKLAKVENYAKNQDWRILTYLNENVILLNLKKVNNKTEFKIVKFENLEFSVDKKSYE